MAASGLDTLLGHLGKLTRGCGDLPPTDRHLLEHFAVCRDETAFAELVNRHGPLVLRVCRRVLHHEQDAEDAFQATFLVLARCHGSIQKRESLTAWLYGVAYRTSMRAKRSAARRRNHEARSQLKRHGASRPVSAASPTWDDVQTILDEEIQRLPATFRAAFVLCVLGGKTVPAAAAELQWKEGTVSSRLTRARQRLQQQLLRRGIQLPALLAALSLAESTQAAVPSGLLQATIRLGSLSVAGGSSIQQVSPLVAALAAGVSRALFLQKARIATLVLLALGLFATGAGVLIPQALTAPEPPIERPGAEDPGPERKTPGAAPKDTVTFRGRVLSPDGQPVAGARLYLTSGWGEMRRPAPSTEYATTGADGRFQVTMPKAALRDGFHYLAATSSRHGPGWVVVAPVELGDQTLRLVPDDVPITGQILDLEGKPVAGATLTVLQINAGPGENLGPWLEAVKNREGSSLDLEQRYLQKVSSPQYLKVTSDAEGRVRLTGIGRNRLVRVQLDGPAIASQRFSILTRHGKTLELRNESGFPRAVTTYYAANFQHVAAPSQLVVGVVRDRDTRKPLAGVTIQSDQLANHLSDGQDILHATTDAQGRYHLTGLPKGKGNVLKVVPPGDLPYVAVYQNVPDRPGFDPVTVDCNLKLGVWIEGKITDKVTGASVPGVVQYHYRRDDNPILRDYPRAAFRDAFVFVQEDGLFRIVGLPGPGLLTVAGAARYLRAIERDDEEGGEPSLPSYGIFGTLNYQALARLDSPKGVAVVKRNITLDPGWTFTGTVVGSDGNPLAGALGYAVTESVPFWDREGMKTAEFTVAAFNPRRPRLMLLQHLEKGLVGVVRPSKENGGKVTVELEPGAGVTGRLVDADGQPRAGVELEPLFGVKEVDLGWPWSGYPVGRIKTDREGRFRIEGLLPDHKFGLSDRKGGVYSGDTLRSGQTRDLGDVRMKPGNE